MKRHLVELLGSGSILLFATQPAFADMTRVTDVQVTQTDAGMEVVLETSSGDRPQVFTVARGTALTADIINAQLDLEEGNGYLQNNPVPGISSIMVAPLDGNSIRVTVNGDGAAPVAQINQGRRNIVLSYAPGDETTQAEVPPAPEAAPANLAPPPPASTVAQVPSPQLPPGPTPGVLVPNPRVMIDGAPVLAPTEGYVPPLLPRAIAPPVGDIAVASIDASPSEIELGSNEFIPRLLLRDAPVREVLSLLGRAAGLNVVYLGPQTGADSADPAAASQEIRISLDIENEPVQNVFNYVLRVADLDANRVGRTIFVGPSLPNSARQVISRTMRLNQVDVGSALSFLVGLGAETAVSRERQVATILPIAVEDAADGQTSNLNQVQTTTEEQIEVQRAEFTDAVPILRGLQVIGDSRTNSVTLVGDARQVEIAAAQLVQLDIRRRQVAINLKVIDVNLLATEDFNTSFSIGWDDGFFVSDGGAASFNYGGINPPSSLDVNASRLSPPVTAAPFPPGVDDLGPFFDSQSGAPFGSNESTGLPQQFLQEVELPDGSTVTVPVDLNNFPEGILVRPPFGTDVNPLQPGITEIEDDGSLEIGLPQLFRYPTRFLASLQAQVVTGNAKVLTDPTLVVQEGQAASVALVQDVVTNITVTRDVTDAGISETEEFEIEGAGLTVNLQVDRIDDNGFVTLQISPTVTAPSGTFDTGEGEITLLATRQLTSGVIRIRDGQTLILSGIIQETDRTTVSKVPILGDIPILGALFRSTNRENTRQEVIILLTPQVLDDSDLSNFGYSYTPGRDAQEVLQRQGVQLP